MNIATKVVREGPHVKIAIVVDGIDCGSVVVAGTSDPKQQHLLDALAEGRMSLVDFGKVTGFSVA